MGREQRRRAPRASVEVCVYCGLEQGTTKDHVPPRALFPVPRPADLVRVPCCETCRKPQGADDEYFKYMTVLRRDVAHSVVGARLVQSVLRGLARPQSQRLTASLVRSFRSLEVRTAAGLYIGHAAAYEANLLRSNAVMRRTLLGLYYHETGTRLPDSHCALAYSVAGLSGSDPTVNALLQRLVKFGTSGKVRVIGQGVFIYAWQAFPDEPHVTVWLFLIYSQVVYMGFTIKREDHP